MKKTEFKPLLELAQLHGVQTSYIDMSGRAQPASPEALLGVLQALGVPISRTSEAAAAQREFRSLQARQWLEPIYVHWQEEPAPLAIQLPARLADAAARWEWKLEDGQVFQQEVSLKSLPRLRGARLGDKSLVTKGWSWPGSLPMGYHQGILECGNERFQTRLWSAPVQCFTKPPGQRQWGLFAPLYALHSKRGWGSGDFGHLRELMTWMSSLGGRFVGTLPLLPAFLDEPLEPSPYSPVSRLFWNEFFIDLHQVPEFKAGDDAAKILKDPAWQRQLAQIRTLPLVSYRKGMRVKRQVLEQLSARFFNRPSTRRSAFERFLQNHPQVEDYARFRALHETRGDPWRQWPRKWREGIVLESDTPASKVQYHLYVQWLAHEQMTALSRHACRLGVDLYLDMPLGTHRDGYDAWRYQDIFALQANGGAPPDPVFTQGQDWGFAPIHPQRSRARGHRYIIAYLQHHLRHAGLLRFDHVMSLHRLYWVPQGQPASQGAYVIYPAEEFYAILSIESHRRQAALLGENLGTVPPEVNQALRRHGVGEMFVVQYECQPHPRPALRALPANCLASVNTHDMPPLANWWNGRDIEDRASLGLLKGEQIPLEFELRHKMKQALLGLLRRGRWLKEETVQAGPVLAALQAFLSHSPAQYLLINLEDLWMETEPQNVPGTSTERINWRRKMVLTLEQIRRDPAVARALRAVHGLRSPTPLS